MHRWRVGLVDIVRIEDDAFALPSERPAPDWAVPDFCPSAGEVGAAFSALAFVDGERALVADPWLANDFPRTLPDADARVARLLAELTEAGVDIASVDTVVNTHWDGIGWNTRPDPDGAWQPTFPNARTLYPRAEIAAWHDGITPPDDDGLGCLDRAGRLEAVDPPVALTPHLTLVDCPGHAHAGLAIRVESEGQLAVYPGHHVLNPWQLGDPSEASDLDPPTATATRRELLSELADREGLLLTTLLGGPGGGTVRRDGPGYRLEVVG
jgi:hypothetical protein